MENEKNSSKLYESVFSDARNMKQLAFHLASVTEQSVPRTERMDLYIGIKN